MTHLIEFAQPSSSLCLFLCISIYVTMMMEMMMLMMLIMSTTRMRMSTLNYSMRFTKKKKGERKERHTILINEGLRKKKG